MKTFIRHWRAKWNWDVHRKIIQPFLPDAPVVVEAGAHAGDDTRKMAAIWKKGVVHAFEPVPEIYQWLSKNTRHLKNVHTYPLALGLECGRHEMFVSTGKSDASSSLLPPKAHLDFHPEVFFNKTIEVSTVSLDQWAEDCGIEKVDFLWLDLQGLELPVLKGGPNLLRSVAAVYLEVHFAENYSGCALFPEVQSWMKEEGFRLAYFHAPREDYGDALFVKSSPVDKRH